MTAIGAPAASVSLGERSYPIYVGEGLLDGLGELTRRHLGDATGCAIVTSGAVDAVCGGRAAEALAGLHPAKILVPDGEDAKEWGEVGRVLGDLIEAGLDRRGAVVALGGGSVGDSAGFAASVYMRGIRHIQVPTTLLGMVDSGVGGKTAVNLPRGKNLAGSFHQPSLVVCDTGLLKTLPDRELRSGLGEVVKYAVIADAELFGSLESLKGRLLGRDPEALTMVVARCAALKAGYVERDERDSLGIRAALNLGHTTGHAMETASGHSIRHGEAVAEGIKAACRVSVSQGLMTRPDSNRVASLIDLMGLGAVHELNRRELVPLMKLDKKSEAGVIRMVLPTGIGTAPVLKPVPEAAILKALEG